MTDSTTIALRISDLLRSRRKPQPSYFVPCCEFKSGVEAIVDPELTRADIIARIKSGEYQNISFIHFVSDGMVDDVTDELLNAAESELKTEARERAQAAEDSEREWADQIAAQLDHDYKLRVEA